MKYDAMIYAIKECEQVDEAKSLRDKAVALAEYYRQAGNTDAERRVSDIRLRAERRVGDLLKELARVTPSEAGAVGGFAKALKNVAPPGAGSASPYAKALTDNNISSQAASRYQALADVPDAVFEEALADPIKKPSSRAMVEKARDPAFHMPNDSLWLWGRMRDMEREKFFDKDPIKLMEPMTESMVADMLRLAPLVAGFFNGETTP